MTAHIPRLPFALDPLIAEAKRRMKRRRILAAVVIVAVAGGAGAIVVVGGPHLTGLFRGPRPRTAREVAEPYHWNAPLMANGVRVPSLAEAQGTLSFPVALPTDAVAPKSMYTTKPRFRDPREQGFAAEVRDPRFGLFRVFEQPTALTEQQLEAWVPLCNTCTLQKVVVRGSRHYLVAATPGRGLGISWLSDSTLYTIFGPLRTFTEADALRLASHTRP